MSSNNGYSVLIFFSLFLLSAHLTSSSSCSSECGGIDIPFPFGIGKGCYLNKWYAIDCVNSSISGKLVPYLWVINKEVVGISYPSTHKDFHSTIRIKNQIISEGCAGKGEEFESLLNLTGTPFYIDNSNSLIAVACNNTASLTQVEPNLVGCKSSCSLRDHTSTQDVLGTFTCYRIQGDYYKYCNERRIANETLCNGIECCQANMPDGIQQIVGMKIDKDTTTTGGCKVAFLTDTDFTSNKASSQRIYAKRYSTITLGWYIQTTNRSFEDSLGCSKNTIAYVRIAASGHPKVVCASTKLI